MKTKGTTKNFETWFGAYAVLGAAASGLVPLLLPLLVSQNGEATRVGLVVAALSVGQLSAPLWGQLADKRHLYRLLFAGGLLLAGLALVGVALSTNPWLLTGLSFLLGLGIAATNTLANLFIVERYPQQSWGARLGLLQTFYGIGQVSGLVIAGLLSASNLTLALGITAVLPFIALGFTPGLPHMPGASSSSSSTPRTSRLPLAHPLLKVESLLGSPAHAYHLLHWGRALRQLKKASPGFLRFQLLWYVINTGSAFIFAFYPLLMAKQYGLSSSFAAWGYAAAAGLGAVLYAPAGRWSGCYGGNRVLVLGIFVRVGTLAGLAATVWAPPTVRGPLALVFFTGMVIAWSLLSVSGSTLAAQSGLPEGESMGLFSANSALANVSGALLGGVLVSLFGYGALPLAATGLLGLGAVLSLGLAKPAPVPKPAAVHDKNL